MVEHTQASAYLDKKSLQAARATHAKVSNSYIDTVEGHMMLLLEPPLCWLLDVQVH